MLLCSHTIPFFRRTFATSKRMGAVSKTPHRHRHQRGATSEVFIFIRRKDGKTPYYIANNDLLCKIGLFVFIMAVVRPWTTYKDIVGGPQTEFVDIGSYISNYPYYCIREKTKRIICNFVQYLKLIWSYIYYIYLDCLRYKDKHNRKTCK